MKLYLNSLIFINIPLYKFTTFLLWQIRRIKGKKNYTTLFKYYFNYQKRLIVLFQNHKRTKINE